MQMLKSQIKEIIWPELKKNGFTSFSPQRAWRYLENTINVVEVQTFDQHIRDGVGCSALSFAVRLGVYYLAKEKSPWFEGKFIKKPKEYECGARGTLIKNIDQAGLFHPWGEYSDTKDRKDVWYVFDDASNLSGILTEVGNLISQNGFQWFDNFNNLRNVLDRSNAKIIPCVENFLPAEKSFAAAELYSAIALQLREKTRAAREWSEVIQNPFYRRGNNDNLLKEAEKRLKSIEDNITRIN